MFAESEATENCGLTRNPLSSRNDFKARNLRAIKMDEIRVHKKILESKSEGRRELIISYNIYFRH
jgi:hypothetical protein